MKDDYNCSKLGIIQGFAVGILLSEAVRFFLNYNSENTVSEDVTSAVGTSHVSSKVDEFKKCLYADYNATTPIFNEVHQAMLPFTLTHFGNASSSHCYGTVSRTAIAAARHNVAALINSESDSCVVFTGCGTESDNAAIRIALHHYYTNANAKSLPQVLPRVITSAIEHPGILKYLQYLADGAPGVQPSIELKILPVNGEGVVDVDALKEALTVSTALVTVMHSNNEVGTIQPLRKISHIIKEYNTVRGLDILLHSDAAQSFGKVMVDVQYLGLDLCTIVGHKFGAPKGVAALYIRQAHRPVRTTPMLHGGGQEGGVRSGTECIPLIVGLGAASRVAKKETRAVCIHMLRCKLNFITKLKELMSTQEVINLTRYNGPKKHYQLFNMKPGGNKMLGTPMSLHDDIGALTRLLARINNDDPDVIELEHQFDNYLQQLPNTVSISFAGLKSNELVSILQTELACSAGSACHGSSAGITMSGVLQAMNVPLSYGLGTLRISFGRHTTLEDVDQMVHIIINGINKLREIKLKE